jgi:hypothetical protein
MKGAIAVPAVKTIIKANSNKIIITGNSQNFFLTFKNCQSSFKNSIYVISKFKIQSQCLGIIFFLSPPKLQNTKLLKTYLLIFSRGSCSGVFKALFINIFKTKFSIHN